MSSGYSSGTRKLPPLSPALITPLISSFQTLMSAQLEMLQEFCLDKLVPRGREPGMLRVWASLHHEHQRCSPPGPCSREQRGGQERVKGNSEAITGKGVMVIILSLCLSEEKCSLSFGNSE